jgi:hypothetical protein
MLATTVTLVTFLATAAIAAPASPSPAAIEAPWVVCTTADQDAACAHLSRAEQLMKENRLKAAERELRHAVAARRAAGQYAGEELWQLAALRLGTGKIRKAAHTLDDLAAAAQRAGDIDRHAIALTEAIFLFVELRDRPAAAVRLDRLRPLLASPYLPVETGTLIRQRLIGV